VQINDGFLIVAYPDENVDTELEFEYWVADVSEDIVQRIEDLNFVGKDGEMILALIILAIIFILLVFCCIAYAISKWCFTPPELCRIEIFEKVTEPEADTAAE